MPDIISPNTGESIGHWSPIGDQAIATILEQIESSAIALNSVSERVARLNRLADILLLRKETLSQLIVDEVGKTPQESADEVDYAVSFLRYGAEVADQAVQVSVNGDRRLRLVPAGPALLITPYNDPLAGITRKIAPALAAGCPAVVKPSSSAQLTAEALFDAIREAGLADVLHLVNHTDRSVSDRLLRAPQFRVLSFTGSTAAGVAIAASSSGSLTRLVLELGGNNPFLVLEGADVKQAVADAVSRKIRAAGQACSAQNRIYVVAEHYGEFRDGLLNTLASVSYGRSDGDVTMGPVRTPQACANLARLTEESRERGEVHVLGKAINADRAFCFPPTVVESDHILQHHEAFGALVSLTRVENRAEGLERARAESQALVCYLYGDVTEADTAQLRFGSIGINSTGIQSANVPTGGFGTAGIGREGSLWGLHEYLTTINERWGA